MQPQRIQALQIVPYLNTAETRKNFPEGIKIRFPNGQLAILANDHETARLATKKHIEATVYRGGLTRITLTVPVCVARGALARMTEPGRKGITRNRQEPGAKRWKPQPTRAKLGRTSDHSRMRFADPHAPLSEVQSGHVDRHGRPILAPVRRTVAA